MLGCCECYVFSDRGLCDELITRPEEYYRLWRVVLCDHETSWTRRPYPALGCRARENNNDNYIYIYIYTYIYTHECVSINSRAKETAKYTTPNKRVWNLPTSTQLRVTWHTDSLEMVVLLSTGASRYHNCCIDGSTSSEYFGCTLVCKYSCSPTLTKETAVKTVTVQITEHYVQCDT
jgi:hypothetical protein